MDIPPPIMYCCRTPGWKPYCGECGYCGKALVNTGYACRAKKSVQPPHLQEYNRNHYWGQARYAALRRDDNKCVKCGYQEQYRCPECGGSLYGGRWCRGCRREPGRGPLEVNHIIPRNGNKDDNSCFHHLDNLETLCHDCHVKETRVQRRHRKAVKLWELRRLRREKRITSICS